MDYIWEPIVGGILGFSYHPNITFFDNPSTILSNRSSYPQGFATPGIVSAITANSGSPYFDFQGNQVAWYVQDDWRVSRKLTLNLGVRHDVDLGLLGVSRQDRNRTYLILKHINSPWASHLPEDSLHDFAPRFGFAFDPKGEGKTVIRGGYGIYYDQTFINIPLFAQQQTYDTVFAQTTSLVNDVIGRGDLATFRVGDPINLAPASTTIAVGSQGRLIDQNYRSPMAQQSNIGFSQQFLKDFVLEVDYTQTLNTNESRRIRANPKIVVGSANPRLLESAFTAAGLPANRLADIIVDSSVNRSRYDGLNIGVRKRLSRRMSFQSSYTLSKAVGYGGTSGEFGATARHDQFHYLDPRELAPTIRDERHRLTFSGVIDLPGGLQISPILQFATPRPYTLNAGTDVNRDGVNPSGTGANTRGRTCALRELQPRTAVSVRGKLWIWTSCCFAAILTIAAAAPIGACKGQRRRKRI